MEATTRRGGGIVGDRYYYLLIVDTDGGTVVSVGPRRCGLNYINVRVVDV